MNGGKTFYMEICLVGRGGKKKRNERRIQCTRTNWRREIPFTIRGQGKGEGKFCQRGSDKYQLAEVSGRSKVPIFSSISRLEGEGSVRKAIAYGSCTGNILFKSAVNQGESR